ncbi:acetylornithine deacetylase/succinyl-diaminopimelate desuccinylase family protein [Angulomicrobium tetraedrale]|uniref:Probable succinyl-diaminopimelate desuccinylase n=1 Tax=Ancylobacter tetraedralis TaxID=217068 RepID=A0A839ZE46_9HYPH|nr:acetylornithine deacetylase/succinyl-diaminopimelate desuccinylase family protein [Ancylobacter tetraedralis]
MTLAADDNVRLAREVEFLKALVRVPSDNPPGDCAPHAEVAGQLLEELGFTVERHPVPEPFVKTYGMKSVVNLVVREHFGTGGPVIALNAHGDVVPPGAGWTFDPYGAEEKGGAIYGRGAAVSKSDFATYAFALLALKEKPEGLNGTVELHFTYDEEAGGFVGPKWLIEQDLTKPDLAISAGFSYAVVIAHNGALHLEIVVRGKQAHAAMPETGADALEAANAILTAIYAERARLYGITSATPGIGSPKITVGLISGGINTNVVPDRIVMRVDRRLTPEEDGVHVEAELTARIEQAVAGLPGIEIECRRIILAEPLRTLPGTEKLVETIQKHAAEVLGEVPPATAVPLYTDARHYTAAGIPTVLYGAGPRSILEANAHAADEHVRISDLAAATRVIEATLRDLLKA